MPRDPSTWCIAAAWKKVGFWLWGPPAPKFSRFTVPPRSTPTNTCNDPFCHLQQVTDRIFFLCRASTIPRSRCTPGRPSNKACRIATTVKSGNMWRSLTWDTPPSFWTPRPLPNSIHLSIPDESVAFDKPDKIGFRGFQ
jgi:hypothetical protein